MQDSYMPFSILVRIVGPRIGSMSFRMVVQVEDFHYSIPDRLPLKDFFDRDTLHMGRLHPMQFVNYIPQVIYMTHDTASTKSPTLQKLDATPAAMAGVMRSVL